VTFLMGVKIEIEFRFLRLDCSDTFLIFYHWEDYLVFLMKNVFF